MSQQPPTSQPSNLEKIDSNFQAARDTSNDIHWMDALEFTLEGQGWPQESEAYCRYPNRAENTLRPFVWELSRYSAGLSVRFNSNASSLQARWKLRSPNLALPHMAATGASGLDLYARNHLSGGQWRWAGSGRPTALENEFLLLNNIVPGEIEYCLYLPLYNGVISLEIGVPSGAVITPTPPRQEKPVCFYGTSIVHGGCASRTGMCYPSLLGRALDKPILNLGFSGNGKSEPEVAELLAELDPCLYVIDPLPNMSAEEVEQRISPFVETLRRQHPTIPIVLVEHLEYQHGWINIGTSQRIDGLNRTLRRVVDGLKAAGVRQLHCVSLTELLGDNREGTVDGVHPTDLGFQRIAQALEPVLRPLLN